MIRVEWIEGTVSIEHRYVPHPLGGITCESRRKTYDKGGFLVGVTDWQSNGARIFVPSKSPWRRLLERLF